MTSASALKVLGEVGPHGPGPVDLPTVDSLGWRGTGAGGAGQAAPRALPPQLQRYHAAPTKPSLGKIVLCKHYAIFPSELQAVFEKK